MNEITGRRTAGGVTVEVLPGGALAALTLADTALTLGPERLAELVVTTVAEATAVADQRTRGALRAALAGLGPAEAALFGPPLPDQVTERAESTTPDSWRSAP